MTASTREGWRRARLETILDLSLALSGPRPEGEIVEELVQQAVGLLDARAGIAISLLPPLEPVTVVSVGWPVEPGSAARLVSSPALHAVREGTVTRTAGESLGVPFSEVLVAPCLWREELMGVVAVADKEARQGQARFDDEDLTFLRSLALLAAPAIASGRMLEEIQRQRLLLEEENRALRLGVGEEAGLVGQAPALPSGPRAYPAGRTQRRHRTAPRGVRDRQGAPRPPAALTITAPCRTVLASQLRRGP